jgi:hypothetical protein
MPELAKNHLRLVPWKFNTFNTFNTFTIFAIFAALPDHPESE